MPNRVEIGDVVQLHPQEQDTWAESTNLSWMEEMRELTDRPRKVAEISPAGNLQFEGGSLWVSPEWVTVVRKAGTPDLKVGNLVQLHAQPEGSQSTAPVLTWLGGMNDYTDRPRRIREITANGAVRLEGSQFYFSPEWVSVVNVAGTPELKVGDLVQVKVQPEGTYSTTSALAWLPSMADYSDRPREVTRVLGNGTIVQLEGTDMYFSPEWVEPITEEEKPMVDIEEGMVVVCRKPDISECTICSWVDGMDYLEGEPILVTEASSAGTFKAKSASPELTITAEWWFDPKWVTKILRMPKEFRPGDKVKFVAELCSDDIRERPDFNTDMRHLVMENTTFTVNSFVNNRDDTMRAWVDIKEDSGAHIWATRWLEFESIEDLTPTEHEFNSTTDKEEAKMENIVYNTQITSDHIREKFNLLPYISGDHAYYTALNNFLEDVDTDTSNKILNQLEKGCPELTETQRSDILLTMIASMPYPAAKPSNRGKVGFWMMDDIVRIAEDRQPTMHLNEYIGWLLSVANATNAECAVEAVQNALYDLMSERYSYPNLEVIGLDKTDSHVEYNKADFEPPVPEEQALIDETDTFDTESLGEESEEEPEYMESVPEGVITSTATGFSPEFYLSLERVMEALGHTSAEVSEIHENILNTFASSLMYPSEEALRMAADVTSCLQGGGLATSDQTASLVYLTTLFVDPAPAMKEANKGKVVYQKLTDIERLKNDRQPVLRLSRFVDWYLDLMAEIVAYAEADSKDAVLDRFNDRSLSEKISYTLQLSGQIDNI